MPTTPTTLTDAPLSPDRSDRATFTARSIALDDWRKLFNVPEMRLALANVYSNALDALASAVAGAASAAASLASANNSAASAAAAGISSGAAAWVSGTTYAQYVVVISPVDFQTYRRAVAGAGTIDPSADNTNWRSTNWVMPLLPKTANYTMLYNDRIKADTTAGTFTLSFPASPVQGAKVFVCDWKNTFGINKLILGRNGSLIEGVAADMDITNMGFSGTFEYDTIFGWKAI